MSSRYLLVLLLAAGLPAHAEVGVRVLLGLMDREATKWDGSAAVDRGRIVKIDPWRFGKDDELLKDGTWKISTAPVLSFLHLVQRQTPPVGANGVILWLSGEDESTEIKLKTVKGSFSFRLGELPYGKFQYALDGNVAADRIPPSSQLTNSPDEQDYPAAAVTPNGDIWLAYVEFRHRPDHDKLRAPYKEPPKDLSVLVEPAQGDQILVKHFAQNRWSDPIAVTPSGGDLYRPALAIDGSGRPWVFWSANQNGNFDLWARVIENGMPGATVQISKDPGSDVFPAAATDVGGRVWVAWQGWRQGKGVIFSAVQQGSGFSAPAAVSNSAANEWNPAIAADSSGRVTVAWDTYRNGSYDVYARTATAPAEWGQEIPVAATARYEAYPSIAYDAQERLWIAYEEGPDGWGKDFGAHRSSGVPIYEARGVRLVGLDRAGQLLLPATGPGKVLQGLADVREDGGGRQGDIQGWEKADSEVFTRRA